jgi:predicted HTH domain antitoxin
MTAGRAFARYARDLGIVVALRVEGRVTIERANELAAVRYLQYRQEIAGERV